VFLSSARDCNIDFYEAVEIIIHFNWDYCQSCVYLTYKVGDFTLFQEEFAGSLGVVSFRRVFFLKRGDLYADDEGFVIAKYNVCAANTPSFCFERFCFVTGELDACRVGFEDLVVEACASVYEGLHSFIVAGGGGDGNAFFVCYTFRMKEAIRDLVREAVPKGARDSVEVLVPDNPDHGHYSTNAAFVVAKIEKELPMEAAEKIKDQILKSKNDILANVMVVAPGFVNFWISDDALFDGLDGVLKKPEKFGEGDGGDKKTVMVEYFQPNIAKVLHVGHLRSAVIGDSVKRMLLSQGYKAVSDTHVGDWGTQFGILLFGYRQLSDVDQKKIEEDPFRYLNDLYAAENKKIDDDPDYREKGKEEFAKLERGDMENRKIWQWMVDVSMKKIEESAELLGLLEFDEHMNESVYEDDMPGITELLLKKKIATKGDDGAVYVDLEPQGLGWGVLIKSDGASTYLLRDLATFRHRMDHWKFWRNTYVVDERQAHHFRQLFAIVELLGWRKIDESVHISFGFMSLPEGKMSTRTGEIIPLQEIVDDMITRAREVIAEKNPDLKDADEVARQVALGALKYFDLSHHRKSNIVFDRERALSFEGNTGPYVQYTYARLRSILRKVEENKKTRKQEIAGDISLDDVERRLLVELLRFPDVIQEAIEGWAPNVVANYVFGLAQKANEFYHSHPVTQEKDEGVRAFRVALVEGVSVTLKNGLYLLGIEAPEEM